MARKTASFGQLLRYIDAPQEKGPALTHNLTAPSDDRRAIRTELDENSLHLPPRKNGNYLYHEILSWGAGDSDQLRLEAMEVLTRRYLEVRAPYALAYARAHFDTANPHVHLLISANELGSRRRMRLSRKAFRQIQQQLEIYQQERYPALSHSLAQLPAGSKERLRQTRTEQERTRRAPKALSRKQVIREVVDGVLNRARDGPDCYRQLLRHGLKLYRRGTAIGIEDAASGKTGRRYRLKTLGLNESFEERFRLWQELNRELPELTTRTRKKRRRKSRAGRER